jgi:predicted small lipoprotein YifL
MKFSLFAALLLALTLTACGDPKPAQYPPSMMMERETMPDDEGTKKD